MSEDSFGGESEPQRRGRTFHIRDSENNRPEGTMVCSLESPVVLERHRQVHPDEDLGWRSAPTGDPYEEALNVTVTHPAATDVDQTDEGRLRRWGILVVGRRRAVLASLFPDRAASSLQVDDGKAAKVLRVIDRS
jgi:hypothetical protein